MKLKSVMKPGWIVTPAASMTMAYGGVIACWFIYLSCTLMFPPIFYEGPYRRIDTDLYVAFTGANVGLALWLLVSLKSARQAAPNVRRGQLSGICLSLIFLSAIQWGAQALHTDLNKANRMSPESISRVIASYAPDGQDAVACVREALQQCYPGLLEAASNDSLFFQHEGRASHRLQLSDTELRLQVYGTSSQLPLADDAPWAFERNSKTSVAMLIPLPLAATRLPRLRRATQGFPRPDKSPWPSD